MAFRFLHTADWQIGLKARHLGDQAGVAREARFRAAEAVIALANRSSVEAVVLAGDTFEDSGVPRESVQRVVDLLRRSQAPVLVLPGNHDPLVPHGIFDHPAWRDASPRVRVLRDFSPIELGAAVLLPSPITSRHSTIDPLAALAAQAGPSPMIRIGIAHGSVRGASVPDSDLADEFPIDLELAARAGLDYLALGHWHRPSQYAFGGAIRAAYCGAHEPTAFGESVEGGASSGQCLIVSIEKPGAPPQLEAHRTAYLTWETRREPLHSAADLAALRTRIDAEPTTSREQTLLRLELEGSLALSEAASLDHLETLLRARFLAARLDRRALRLRPDDADWIDSLPAGAPAVVARALLQDAAGQGHDAAIAERALLLLHELEHETEPG